MSPSVLINILWDTQVFGVDTYELSDASEDVLRQAVHTPGHHTVRVDPLASKQLLHEYGFYYCDTLIEPYCRAEKLKILADPDCNIGKNINWQELLLICHGAFEYGRFHRDFSLDKECADVRYNNWLRQLYDKQNVYGLFWRNQLAGFIAYSENNLLLHAVDRGYRGRGLAKYWWSAACSELIKAGNEEITSSISAANMGALNLYASLGFGFRNPVDIYHRLVR